LREGRNKDQKRRKWIEIRMEGQDKAVEGREGERDREE